MSAPSFVQLAAERYVSLVTFRRNGNGVPTPVWIAGAGGKLYVVTNGTSVKMKRLKANDRVQMAACDARGKVRGEWTEGRARRADDPATAQLATRALEQKYGWQIAVFKFFSSLAGRAKNRTFIEISTAS
jgi:PPOX class probable F420-dependent enzyme